jgi:hypothetical protein
LANTVEGGYMGTQNEPLEVPANDLKNSWHD